VIYCDDDRKIYHDLIASVYGKRESAKSVSRLVLTMGKYFLGFPYAHNTLETEGRETLVINLREFDCFTFIENVVVLARLINEKKHTFEDFTAEMERCRYRNGIVDGYASRLHYFSDWLFDNEKKGIIKDVTSEMGGKCFLKKINYMTSHPDNYSVLNSKRICRKMQAVERNLSEKPFYYIPKAELKKIQNAIEEEDIIAMTTSVEGLDVVHVGIVVCLNGKIHLLHASEVEKKVVISDATLYQYLAGRKTMTGIMVGRVREACQNGDNLTAL
jgi:hypothetical protein